MPSRAGTMKMHAETHKLVCRIPYPGKLALIFRAAVQITLVPTLLTTLIRFEHSTAFSDAGNNLVG